MQLMKTDNNDLIEEIKTLINQSKVRVARILNAEMTMLYWQIGKRISLEILKEQRAEYGEKVVASLARVLTAEYGNGFTRTALIRMIKFYELFNDLQISATVSQQLSWSHIIELLPLKEERQREFYAFMAIEERWSVRQLRSNIYKMLYERTLSSRKENNVTLLKIEKQEELPVELVLKDPYLLDFLNLPDNHYESELEDAILQEIEQFILELGTGFSFVARQKRITIDNEHFYLDLLFFNRRLKRLVAIELKSGKFKAEYKGQMELYLNWLKKYECLEEENPPIGIILCTEKSHAQIELLDLPGSGIHVAEYWTSLPPIDVFQRKVQEIVRETKLLYEKAHNKNEMNGPV